MLSRSSRIVIMRSVKNSQDIRCPFEVRFFSNDLPPDQDSIHLSDVPFITNSEIKKKPAWTWCRLTSLNISTPMRVYVIVWVCASEFLYTIATNATLFDEDIIGHMLIWRRRRLEHGGGDVTEEICIYYVWWLSKQGLLFNVLSIIILLSQFNKKSKSIFTSIAHTLLTFNSLYETPCLASPSYRLTRFSANISRRCT